MSTDVLHELVPCSGLLAVEQVRTRCTFSCSAAALLDRTVVSLRGELDVLAADEFRDCIYFSLGEQVTLIDLDLADLSFIDARGVREIHRALSLVRGRGGEMVISAVSPFVYKVLLLTGSTKMMCVVDTLEEAGSNDIS